MTAAARRALAVIAVSQLLALSLWFSASAVAPQLAEVWQLDAGEQAWLTLAVQIGFVAGALGSAVLALADRVPARRLFLVSALVGALANLGLLAVTDRTVWVAMLLRTLTGAALAGVYPSGMKVMAGWFLAGRGRAIGILVGALAVGSATPHLVRGVGLPWEAVLATSSALAVVAALMMWRWVGDGPHEAATSRFDVRLVGRLVRNRRYRLTTMGYLGHMWELYAMWTWLSVWLVAAPSAELDTEGAALLAFAVISAGGAGSWMAGVVADRRGREPVAGASLAISGLAAGTSWLAFDLPVGALVPFVIVWGITVVADSAQFSTLTTEVVDATMRGTALTLQTALGFLLTLVTIRGVPVVVDAVGWRWAFIGLAAGPVVGVGAMVRLRSIRHSAAPV